MGIRGLIDAINPFHSDAILNTREDEKPESIFFPLEVNFYQKVTKDSEGKTVYDFSKYHAEMVKNTAHVKTKRWIITVFSITTFILFNLTLLGFTGGLHTNVIVNSLIVSGFGVSGVLTLVYLFGLYKSNKKSNDFINKKLCIYNSGS